MTEEIDREAVFSIAPGLEVTPVPDGSMIYQNSRERVHYLNPTATIVFELCGMGKSFADIESFISDGFALGAPPSDDIRACLNSLLVEGLVTGAGAPVNQ